MSKHFVLQARRLFAAALLAVLSVASPQVTAQGAVYNIGDDPDWSDPDYDASAWLPLSQMAESPEDVFWIRHPLIVDDSLSNLEAPIITIESASAFEIYWDGIVLGRSGYVGAIEAPGFARATFSLPPDLVQPGHHVLALRLSSQNRMPGQSFFVEFTFEEGRDHATAELLQVTSSGAIGGLALVLAAFFTYLAIIRSQQRLQFSIAALLSLNALFLMAFEISNTGFTLRYPADYLATRLVPFPAAVLYFGIPFMIATRFSLKPVFVWPIASLGVLGVAILISQTTAMELDAAAFACLCLSGIAVSVLIAREKRRSGLILGLAFALAALAILAAPDRLYLFAAIFMVILAFDLALDMVVAEITLS